jgi:hypothetical protein
MLEFNIELSLASRAIHLVLQGIFVSSPQFKTIGFGTQTAAPIDPQARR